ncbi:SWIM zinc finger family protein [Streptomonospora sp. S1-112]|uniref:SWIM zinc finger family protein n=1 Tax=Streptomonospora mangrovi TaxID=2883123 RepID=A0A9X3NL93_9ACTN|nr:SWIM zinc finger family protein [Streptomonospora mangrovi]MDA0565562.1 SWIM zinc finger family protein [Streptomonospora mangrovi]
MSPAPAARPGAEWARLLRGLAPDPAPPLWRRARALAESGAVSGLKVLPGEAAAQVRGPGGPAAASLLWPPAQDQEWDRAARALADQPVFRDAVLAGLLPVEAGRVWELVGWPALPRRFGEVACVCSCPAWEDPCVHAAALLFALADQVERDPFTVAAWRGCAREELLERVRRAAAPDPAPAAAADPGEFWAAPPLPALPPLPGDPAATWAPPPGGADGEDVAAVLAPLYARLLRAETAPDPGAAPGQDPPPPPPAKG